MRLRGLGGGHDLGIAGARTAESDVLADRGAEQEDVLADIGDLAAQRAARNRRDVLIVDGDDAAADLVEAQDQVQHRRFAAA